jgi:molecular chaperone GrpE
MPSSPVTEEGHGEAGERAAAGAAAQTVDRAEQADLEDRYRRALADLDNYRKRVAREIERRVDEAREALARDWLEAVDSVERALRAASPDNPLAEGFRALLEQMESTLARHGITRRGAVGEQFDPERHEAVDVLVTDEAADRSVVDVVRSGYAIDGRTLRPAQVVVSRRSDHDR